MLSDICADMIWYMCMCVYVYMCQYIIHDICADMIWYMCMCVYVYMCQYIIHDICADMIWYMCCVYVYMWIYNTWYLCWYDDICACAYIFTCVNI